MKPFTYSQEQLEFLASFNGLKGSRKDRAAAFNAKFGLDKTEDQINSLCKRKGFYTGCNGRFTTGQKSWNKGKKCPQLGSSTSFKKGNRPQNAVPVGTEVLTTRDEYVKVKVAEPNTWRFKHLIVWEQHNGPVPEGHAIAFIDLDRQNCAIENLELVTRQELLQRNRMKVSDWPAELRPTGAALAKLKAKTYQLNQKD